MIGSHHAWIVTLSILVAISVSHAALSLAQRMARSKGVASRLWLAGGAVSMGVGIWSMHFIGMMALRLPIGLAYDIPVTLLSLGFAIAASAYALSIAAAPQITFTRQLQSAAVLGTGICGMHYTGMAAITIQPRLEYDPLLLGASVAIALAASFVALSLFFRLRALHGWTRHVARLLAAVVMGFAIAGMHYVGMAATVFPAGAWCSGGVRLDQDWLAILIAIVALGLLAVTAVLLMVDSHLASRTRHHARELQQANQRLQHAATHDALTALPNRVLLLDRLERAIAHTRRSKAAFAVAVIDLDRFKAVNDSLGHAAGDELLRTLASRISSALRESDTLARVGGDEFVALLPGIDAPAAAAPVLAKIQQQIGGTLQLSGVDLQVASSIGVAFCPADAVDAASLLKHADAAMYHAKRQGRNNAQFYAEGMGSIDRERLELESGLRRALANGELLLHYQPKVDVRTGRIKGAEALVRWNHPVRGIVPPAVFIPIAEETGMIRAIGEWVLVEACRELRRWHDAGFTHLTMAVNLSAEQFTQIDLVDRVRCALAAAGVAPRHLDIELTESAVMGDPEQSIRVLGELVRLGVKISVDDFGTGYSSLSYLRRLPLHSLKIDRSFIRDIETSSEDAEIVRAIVSLAHSLALKVTAEGVESAAQHAFVRKLGCEQYQGFLCSAPLPAADFMATLHTTTTGTGRLRVLDALIRPRLDDSPSRA